MHVFAGPCHWSKQQEAEKSQMTLPSPSGWVCCPLTPHHCCLPAGLPPAVLATPNISACSFIYVHPLCATRQLSGQVCCHQLHRTKVARARVWSDRCCAMRPSRTGAACMTWRWKWQSSATAQRVQRRSAWSCSSRCSSCRCDADPEQCEVVLRMILSCSGWRVESGSDAVQHSKIIVPLLLLPPVTTAAGCTQPERL